MLSVRMRMKQLVTAALTIFVLSWALAVTPASASFTQEAHPDEDFFAMCAEGEDEMLREELKKNPFWSNARTPDGESCLHLASLGGSNKVTKLLMEYGADPLWLQLTTTWRNSGRGATAFKTSLKRRNRYRSN